MRTPAGVGFRQIGRALNPERYGIAALAPTCAPRHAQNHAPGINRASNLRSLSGAALRSREASHEESRILLSRKDERKLVQMMLQQGSSREGSLDEKLNQLLPTAQTFGRRPNQSEAVPTTAESGVAAGGRSRKSSPQERAEVVADANGSEQRAQPYKLGQMGPVLGVGSFSVVRRVQLERVALQASDIDVGAVGQEAEASVTEPAAVKVVFRNKKGANAGPSLAEEKTRRRMEELRAKDPEGAGQVLSESAAATKFITPEETLRNELAAYERVGEHPNVCRQLGFWEEEKKLFAAMELCQSDVSKHLSRYGPPPEDWLRRWAFQLILALSRCHDRGVLHRDIRLPNFLLRWPHPEDAMGYTDDEGRELDCPSLVLSDFGMATLLSDPNGNSVGFREQQGEREEEQAPWDGSGGLVTADGVAGGQGLFLAPEIKATGRGGRKADIWSAAAALLSTLHESVGSVEDPRMPSFDPMAVLTGEAEGTQRLSRAGRILLASMLAEDPKLRPDAWTLLQHEWFWDL